MHYIFKQVRKLSYNLPAKSTCTTFRCIVGPLTTFPCIVSQLQIKITLFVHNFLKVKKNSLFAIDFRDKRKKRLFFKTQKKEVNS